MAESWTSPAALPDEDAVQLRRIRFADLGLALQRGWQDFLATPTQLVFLCVIYPLVGIVAGTMAAGGDVMHLFYPMAAGFALIGPLAALGIYEISRRRERGQQASWLNVFDVVRSPAIGAIGALGLLLVALFLVWLWAADTIFAMTLARVPLDVPPWQALFHTHEGWQLIWMGNGVGFLFALAVLVLTTVSFPMLLDRGGGVSRAVGTSVRAFLLNPLQMLAWGLIVAVILLLGSIPLFVGLAVALPVLGHATWHLYRLLVH